MVFFIDAVKRPKGALRLMLSIAALSSTVWPELFCTLMANARPELSISTVNTTSPYSLPRASSG